MATQVVNELNSFPKRTASSRIVELVPPMKDGLRPPSIYISRERAELQVARGQAKWATDGTRRVYALSITPRGQHREWRKTICYDPDTGTSLPTMQLVPTAGNKSRSR